MKREGFSGKKLVLDFPDDVPDFLQVLLAFVVLSQAKREAAAAALAGKATHYFFLKIFPRAFLGSGPVVHSGDEGRTGGGGPGGFGVQGGIGIFMPRFLSLGACCRLLLAMATSFAGIQRSLRDGARDRFRASQALARASGSRSSLDHRGPYPPPVRLMGLAKIQGFSRKKTFPLRAP